MYFFFFFEQIYKTVEKRWKDVRVGKGLRAVAQQAQEGEWGFVRVKRGYLNACTFILEVVYSAYVDNFFFLHIFYVILSTHFFVLILFFSFVYLHFSMGFFSVKKL